MSQKITSLNTFYQLKINQKVPSHFLLVSDKKQLHHKALLIIKSLICSQNATCGHTCLNCQKIERQVDDTFFVLQNSSTSKIKRHDLTALFSWVESTKFYPHQRVYYFPDLENLTTAASNTLLKFLETPQPNCLGVFTSSNPQLLLPTIQSRLQTFYLEETFREFAKSDLYLDLKIEQQNVLQFLNRDLYAFDPTFIKEQYLPSQQLVNRFLSMFTQKDLTDFYLLDDQQLSLSRFWLFLEILIINLLLLLKKQSVLKKIVLTRLFDCCCRVFYQNAEFYQQTGNNLSPKNTFLFWLDEVNGTIQ